MDHHHKAVAENLEKKEERKRFEEDTGSKPDVMVIADLLDTRFLILSFIFALAQSLFILFLIR